MKKFILPALLLALATSAQAQTKRIAHRSHSGSNRSFSLSGLDNFGNPPREYETSNDTKKTPEKKTARKRNTKKVQKASATKPKKAMYK